MSHSAKTERRALSQEELELVDRTRHPGVGDLDDAELAKLLKLLRERRDRAQSEAGRQRREMRGKGAPKGQAPASGDTGTRAKAGVLAMAVRRLNGEVQRRRRKSARAELMENATRALEMRRTATRTKRPAPGRTADKGMKSNPRTKARELARPAEVGRVSQFVKDAQAKRDS